MDEYLKTKSLLMGAVMGAAVLGFVGFNFLGWKSAGKADALAKQEANVALIAGYARICKAQFDNAKDASARLTKLETTDRWSRGDVLAKSGYATMQGTKEPYSGVPQACADLLFPEKS